MVSFLLDNALGAWWAARRLTEQDLKTATSEEELRRKASIPGVPLDYLRFVQDDDGTWAPAAGTFDGWPEQLKDLTTLDPCCGSGHFLVSIFLMLVPMRMERDGLSAQDAVDAVLRENIHGLEIDQRCVELAAFALALTAWKYPDAGGYRALPELNLACSGLSVNVAKEEWKQLGLGKHNLSIALDWMHDAFKHAASLGSLLNPAKTAAAKLVNWDELSANLDKALRKEQTVEQEEYSIAANGIARAATLLTKKYFWVATNVPFKETKQLAPEIQEYVAEHYGIAKTNLATVFVLRISEMLKVGGVSSMVTPHEWLFLGSYAKVRQYLLETKSWVMLADLGEHAFESSQAAGAFTALVSLEKSDPAEKSVYFGIDALKEKNPEGKRLTLKDAAGSLQAQGGQLKNPDFRIGLHESSDLPLLLEFSDSFVGLQNGDAPKYICQFWEIFDHLGQETWEYFQLPCDITKFYNGRDGIVRWEKGRGEISTSSQARIQGTEAWGKFGVAIRQTRTLPATIYDGSIYDQSSAAIIPTGKGNLEAIFAFCFSPEFHDEVRKIDKKKNVTNATLVKIPFDELRWIEKSKELFPRGLPKPFSDDQSQWIFHGHPCGSVVWDEDAKWTADGQIRTDDTVLHVAIARLLGYRWPAELDSTMDLADEQRAWVDRCDALLPHADEDGIVCIPPIRGEAKAEDRLLNLLAAAYGDAWTTSTLPQLLASADHAGKSLDTWLRDKFFTQHCKLFQHRPFIWHIWDGLKDGFAALVNYHKLDRKMLETLIYTYLGDWMKTQRDDIARGVDGAQEKLAAADALKKKLELILEGESPHDIFVRWKPLEEQPIGWNPDLNDGVRLNIRPFLTVGDVSKRDAGILRDKPNIKWTKDRGKDVVSAPWFDTFDGDRINDHHLSLAEKKAAREAAK